MVDKNVKEKPGKKIRKKGRTVDKWKKKQWYNIIRQTILTESSWVKPLQKSQKTFWAG